MQPTDTAGLNRVPITLALYAMPLNLQRGLIQKPVIHKSTIGHDDTAVAHPWTR